MPLTSPPAPGTTAQANAGGLIVALLGFAGFVVLTIIVAARVVIPFDQPLLAVARTWDGWPDLWNAVSQSANIPLIVIGFALVAWLFLTKRRREALLVFLMLAAVTAGSEGVKQLVARPRPAGTDAAIPGVVYSFPSGHTLEVLTILGLVALRSWRSHHGLGLRLAVVVAVTIEVILVAIARLALNEHYPSDVLGGFLGGIGVLGLYAWLTRPGAWAAEPAADSHDGPRRAGGSLGGDPAGLGQRQVRGDREVGARVVPTGRPGSDGSLQPDAGGPAIEGEQREHVAEVRP
jgi:undecaprenyl-diphosphatase